MENSRVHGAKWSVGYERWKEKSLDKRGEGRESLSREFYVTHWTMLPAVGSRAFRNHGLEDPWCLAEKNFTKHHAKASNKVYYKAT